MSGQHTARATTVALLAVAALLVPSHAPQLSGRQGRTPTPSRVWPLTPAPRVLSGFDPPGNPWDAGHRGVDLAGSAGQSVRAALAGTVRFAGRIAGRGVVVVDHGDTRSTYEPVDATVAVGSPVATGQMVGTLRLVGGHCLPSACLHWGLLRGETYLDPLTLLGGGAVRLLPLWSETPAPGPGPAGAPSRSGIRPASPAGPSPGAALVLGEPISRERVFPKLADWVLSVRLLSLGLLA